MANSPKSKDDFESSSAYSHDPTLGQGGFLFREALCKRASSEDVDCCHFSSDGRMLATSDGTKALLWYTDTMKPKTRIEGVCSRITDVRFSPSMERIATTSNDSSVMVWDVDRGHSLRYFPGHSASAVSLDFHPNNDNLICSCDGDGEIRYWNFENRTCSKAFKGGSVQVRFQPHRGRYLAAASESVVSILDVNTQACLHSLEGHTKAIRSICWDPFGELLASVSAESIRIWTFAAGSEGKLLYEYSSDDDNFFHCCVFHHTYNSLLFTGCYKTFEVWNMVEHTAITLPAHEGLITSMGVSPVAGLVASTSSDHTVKLWK